MKITLKIFFLIVIPLSCNNFIFLKNNKINSKKKFYIGRSTTETFQKKISEVFRDNLYSIDEYQNRNTDSKIISKWKINYSESNDSNSVEYKTRFIFIGLIDNTTYSKNNSFQYECYLHVENYVYLDGNYIQEYDSKFIKNEVNIIKSALQMHFMNK